MYYVNRISSHASAPSAPDLQWTKQINRYLYGFPQLPIMYPVGLYGTANYDLRQEISPGNSHSQNISNCLFAFAYEGEGRTPNDKLIIACVILCIFGIYVHWSNKTQLASAPHTT